jgi:hypothetical protein
MQIDMKGKKLACDVLFKKQTFEETQIQKEKFPFFFN